MDIKFMQIRINKCVVVVVFGTYSNKMPYIFENIKYEKNKNFQDNK